MYITYFPTTDCRAVHYYFPYWLVLSIIYLIDLGIVYFILYIFDQQTFGLLLELEPENILHIHFINLISCSSLWTRSLSPSCWSRGFSMEPTVNRVWPRVFQRLYRTSALPRRTHSGCAERADVPASAKPALLVSRLYQPSNLRDAGPDSRLQGELTCKSQRLMQQAGLIHPSNPGCYYYLPTIVRSMEKLVRLVFVFLMYN